MKHAAATHTRTRASHERLAVANIEETANGAVACQMLDAIFPGDVPVSKIRWDAKPHECIDNYKIIQRVFSKNGVDKYIGAHSSASHTS